MSDTPGPDIEFYSIAGLIVRPIDPLVAFAGYFKKSHPEVLEYAINGELIDPWGPLDIEGRLTEDRLSFKGKYSHRQDTINYEFRKCGDLWIGYYSGEINGRGGALARVNTLLFGGSDIQSVIERTKKGFLRDMVEEGKIGQIRVKPGSEEQRSQDDSDEDDEEDDY